MYLLGLLVLVALVVTLVAVGPWWPYSRGWGYRPTGVILLLVLAWLVVIWADLVVIGWPWSAPQPALN